MHALHRGATAVLSELQSSRQLRDPTARALTNLEKLTEVAERLYRLRVGTPLFNRQFP